jgi:hypothetical protein
VELPTAQCGRRLDGAARPLALWSVPLRDVGHGWDYFSGQPSFADDLVPRASAPLLGMEYISLLREISLCIQQGSKDPLKPDPEPESA